MTVSEDIFSLVRGEKSEDIFCVYVYDIDASRAHFFTTILYRSKSTFFLRDSLRLTYDLCRALSRAFLDVIITSS